MSGKSSPQYFAAAIEAWGVYCMFWLICHMVSHAPCPARHPMLSFFAELHDTMMQDVPQSTVVLGVILLERPMSVSCRSKSLLGTECT